MWVESAHVKRTPPTRAGTLRDGQGPSGRPRDSQGWPGTFQGDSGTFREVRDRIRETQGPGMLRGSGTCRDTWGSGTTYRIIKGEGSRIPSQSDCENLRVRSTCGIAFIFNLRCPDRDNHARAAKDAHPPIVSSDRRKVRQVHCVGRRRLRRPGPGPRAWR